MNQKVNKLFNLLKKNKHIVFLIISLLFYLLGYLLAYPNIPRSVYYGFRLDQVLIDIIEKSIIFIFTLFLSSLLWKSKITRLFSLIILLLLSVNFIISITLRVVYKSNLNNGIALSIINSNPQESLSMAMDFIFPILFGIVFFIILFFTVNTYSKFKLSKSKVLILFFAFICILTYDKYGYVTKFHEKNVWEFRPEKRKYFSNLYPFYHLNYFIVGFQFVSDLKTMNSKKVDYHLKYTDNKVQNFVLVIGESARRDNMALYGYGRDTTPNELKEKDNMLLYTNAVSPAPLTLISIPLMLSVAMPEDYSYSSPKFIDNIVNLANHAGFETYWLTTQKFPGQDISLLSVFENYAKHVKRVDGVYDEKLLPRLDTVLKDNRKKLIILHINGSHPTYCDKYPETEAFFSGSGGNRDCYDNTIRYTDKILGEMFKKLQNSSSILVYVSDHGKTYDGKNYIHADVKDNATIPFYIWYSDKVDKALKKTGTVEELTQTTILYDLMANLMGISTGTIPDYNKYHQNLKFVKSDMSIVDYNKLPEK